MDKKQGVRRFILPSMLAAGALFYIVYCNYVMCELPHLTWFDQLNYLEAYYSGNFGIGTFLGGSGRYGEHGLLGYNILFMFNALVLGMTTSFDVYINDFVVIGCAAICMWAFYKASAGKSRGLVFWLGAILITLISFSSMQASSGGMETQVRLGILAFVIVAYLLQKPLYSKVNNGYLALLSFSIFVSINVFGTLYSMAGIPVVFLILLCRAIYQKKLDKTACVIGGSFIAAVPLYIVEYNIFSVKSLSENGGAGLFMSAIQAILHPVETLKAFFAYNGSSVFGYGAWADGKVSNTLYLLVGMLITILMAYAIWRFIKCKMYKATTMSILLIGYNIFVFILTFLGRTGNWQWFINEWYQVHTKVGLIGIVWVICWDFANYSNEKRQKYKSAVSAAMLLSLIALLLVGNAFILMRAPSLKAYYEEKQPYLFAKSIDELPVDANGNTPLLANPQITMAAINLMREHALSVYKYYPAQHKMDVLCGRGIGQTKNSMQIINGIDSDYWVEKNASLKIKTGEAGKVNFIGYYPNKVTGQEKGEVYVNGKYNCNYDMSNVKDGFFTFTVNTIPNSTVIIEFKNGFSFKGEPPDNRDLMFILNDIEGL